MAGPDGSWKLSGDGFFDWLAGVKHINDAHGHLVGDAILREISNRLQASVRTYDCIGRYAGEEFLIMIPSCDPPDLRVGAERLRLDLADEPVETSFGPLGCGLVLVHLAPMEDEGISDLEA